MKDIHNKYSCCEEFAVPNFFPSSFVKHPLSLFLISTFIICFFPFPTKAFALDKTERNQLNTKEEATPFSAKRHSIFSQEKNYSINVNYPSFGTVLVDNDITTWVHQRVNFFQEGLMEIPVSDPEFSTLHMDYTVSHTSLRCISILFSIKTQTGSPNVEEGLMTITYQAQEGRRLKLDDIFANTDGLLDFFSRYCRRALTFRDWIYPDMVFIHQGTTPHKVNFMFFTITPYGLDIHFPPNQVASSYEGPVVVSIPFAELTPYQPNKDLWGNSSVQ